MNQLIAIRTYSSVFTAENACGSSLYGVLHAGQSPFKFSLIWCQHHMQTLYPQGHGRKFLSERSISSTQRGQVVSSKPSSELSKSSLSDAIFFSEKNNYMLILYISIWINQISFWNWMLLCYNWSNNAYNNKSIFMDDDALIPRRAHARNDRDMRIPTTTTIFARREKTRFERATSRV